MTAPVNKEILEKIKKLLRLDPSRGATQGEVEQALMAAQRLALKHGIDLAEIDTTEDTAAGEPFVQQVFRPTREGGGECAARLPSCHKFIRWILEKFFNVKIVMVEEIADYTDKGVKKFGKRLHLSFVGRQTNVQIAIYVYGFLHREFIDLWHKHRKETDAPMSSRNSFFYGTYLGLCDKLLTEKGKMELEEQKHLDEAAGNKNLSLILIGEKEKLKQALDDEHPRLVYTKVSEGRTDDYGAVDHGVQVGKKIKIRTALK